MPTFAQIFGQAQEKGITTPEIESMTRLVREAQQDVVMRIRERENAKSELRKSRREGLLASKESIQDIKRMDLEVKELSKRAKLLSLNLDLEKICAFLQKELEGSVEPSELRGLVAEVSLIDRQLSGVISSVDLGILGSGAAGSAAGADTAKNSADQTVNFEALLLVDENEVSLISTAVSYHQI